MSLEIRRVPLDGHAISAAYLSEYERVARFYLAGPPSELASYREVAKHVRDAYPNSHWDALADSVRPEDAQVGQRLKEIVGGRGLFVATGHQAGLFTGPLLTLYKALTAARLANALESRLGMPVMPLFTVASEDHDWEEVNHAHVIDLENRLLRLDVRAPTEPGREAVRPPIHRIPVGPDAQVALDQLGQATPGSEFKARVLEPLRDAYQPGRSMSAAFERALGYLLRRYSFLVIQTSHPFVKRVTRELLLREWEGRTEIAIRVKRQAQEIDAAGFPVQVTVTEGVTNLFIEGALGRDRVLADSSGGRLRRSGESLTPNGLRQIFKETPDRVSPGVLLRPVAEATAFPVVAYVAGPSEIAYLAQSQALFAFHGVPAPVVVARASIQLIEPKVEAVLEKYSLEASDLAGDSTRAISRLLKEQTPPALTESLQVLRAAVESALGPIESAAISFDPGSKSAVGRGKRAIFQGIETLERKLGDRVKEKHQVMRNQLEKVAVHLFPRGHAQERVLNVYPYLVRYGDSMLDAIYDSAVAPIE